MILALACMNTLHAQVMQRSAAGQAIQPNVRHSAIDAGENQQWWGFMGNANNFSNIGIGVKDIYHCAMYLPGNHDVTGGKTLVAIRFALMASHASNIKVWTATSLPAAAPSSSNTLWMADVDESEVESTIDVALDTPYAIPAAGVYVGYSFEITATSTSEDQFPVVTSGQDMPDGFYIRTATNMPQWSNMYGQGFGVLAMKVLLDGTFDDHLVSPSAQQSAYYAQVGQSVDVDLVLTNNGQATVNTLSYTIASNGTAGDEQTVTLGSPIATYDQGKMTVSIPAAAAASSGTMTLTVTKVNGQANMSAHASTDFTLYTMERLIQRNVVVEEFTGTGCGWCPRGLVGMEKLRTTFGDRFIGIGIHQYNTSDAMYIANYANLHWESAPSCRINRGESIDPYSGTKDDICDDFRAEMNEPAMVSVSVVGAINESETEIEATATIESLFDTSDYTLEFVVVGDGLSGTTTAWVQSNYYANQSASSVEEDLRIFCSGGKYGKSSIAGYVFNDVALASSYSNGVNKVEALGRLTGGEARQVSYTLTLPTKATLRNAMKKGTLYVVALLIDANGRIANAAKRMVGETDGIRDAECTAGNAGCYDLNGRQLQAPQPGVNIVRMSNGSVRKVVVK